MFGNFGSSWFWNLLLTFAIIGVIASVVGLICGVTWLINHIRFV